MSRSHSHHASAKGPAKGPSQRQLRVGENIRHILADLLSRGDVRDPALKGVIITVTEVTCSPDLRNATVFCTPLGGKNAPQVIEALNRHKGFLRGELGHKLDLRYTPSLNFAYDTSFDRGKEIDALLSAPEIKADVDRGDGGTQA
jgi:ribosome-binding factor A